MEGAERYLDKSGDEEIFTDNLIENDQGFASWNIHRGKLVILNVFGAGQFWDSFFVALAKGLGVNKITFGTRRNPKAFERKYGYKVVGYILEKEV